MTQSGLETLTVPPAQSSYKAALESDRGKKRTCEPRVLGEAPHTLGRPLAIFLVKLSSLSDL